jgi:TRAP-type C4-dicarboxylate transport system permease small subunit
MLQIICRYFFKPLPWPIEFTSIAFIWVTLFGACLAQRHKSHVTFSTLYDKMPLIMQDIMRVIGNFLLIGAFMISFAPSLIWVLYMAYRKSYVLRIPLNIAYFPFVIFLAVMIGRLAVLTVEDIEKLIKDIKKWLEKKEEQE